MDAPAVVVAYDQRWPQLFESLRARVDAVLGGIPHVTVHVGSTAVPGLDAKPIIDLDVVVPGPAVVADTVAALAGAGWRHEGDLGIAGREAFRPPPSAAYHHLYVVTEHSQAYRDHLDLRDYLRSHPAEAARYAALKRKLAPLLQADREAYLSGKAGLIAELLSAARRGGPGCPDARQPR